VKVTFLLPGGGTKPIGGYKVVYEYANELAARNHEVTVVHAAHLPDCRVDRVRAFRGQVLSYSVRGALQLWRPDRWFAIDPRVRMAWVPSLRPGFVPDADVIVATWWLTAEIIAAWPEAKGRKYYLIQHLETWGGPEQRVLATWRMPFTKIVIARWLEEFGSQLGEHCYYIPNGLNFAAFGVDSAPAERSPRRVAMLYHEQDWKGSSDGIAALNLAKSALADLQVDLFGTARRPVALPEWISYHKNPRQSELRAIYNRSAIFAAPSWTEGWPLPPAEAMMCGCALVCTDIGGHREYATQGVTALTSPVRNPTGLAENIKYVATQPSLRLALSTQGHQFIQQFTWQRATHALEAVLTACKAPTQANDSAVQT
jgi:glycosyltransferase involved in cell wall biosynthesis